MKTTFPSKWVLAVAIATVSTMSFAETGAALYKANCQSCHGATGTPNPGMAKVLGVKPAAEYKGTEKEEFDAVKNGKGKMKPFAGKLNDEQIKETITFFRTLK